MEVDRRHDRGGVSLPRLLLVFVLIIASWAVVAIAVRTVIGFAEAIR